MNNSIQKSNLEEVKMLNFSSNDSNNNIKKSDKSYATNLDNCISINSNIENNTTSFLLDNKTKDIEKRDENKLSVITPISNQKIENQITPSGTSNIFSEIQLNSLTSKQNEEENKIKEKDEKNQININDLNLDDGSLEYSKSKSYIINEGASNQDNSPNQENIDHYINNTKINHNSRQISYHNKKKKEDNEESINKENDNPNNNKEIIYYNKNFLAGNNNSSQKDNHEEMIQKKNSSIKKVHSLTNIMNYTSIQRYNSITNKTNSLNQKLYTYTSPNVNKNKNIFDNKLNNTNSINKETNKLFIAYDNLIDLKNIGIKNDFDNNSNNMNNKYKKSSKNDRGKIKTKFRRSSAGNTTLSSIIAKNTEKQSLTSNNYNNNSYSSNLIYGGRMANKKSLIKNIPINVLLRLRDWLISCDLLSYYNILVENNMYDIDRYINGMQNNQIDLTYKDIEDIGIRKPGHIFRLLLKLEIDSGILDNNLFDYILSKFNSSSSISNNILMTSSVAEIGCCGICHKNNYSYMKRNDCPYNDIFSFLKYKGLWKFKENFLHNGFDQLEYVLLQLFSKYKFNKEIINDYFHIYSEKDKIFILNKLYQEKKNILAECGMEYDEDELNEILLGPNLIEKRSTNEEKEKMNEKNKSLCNIF